MVLGDCSTDCSLHDDVQTNKPRKSASDERMKQLLTVLALGATLLNSRAGGLPPESFGGAAWGTVIGGLSGADCNSNWSNDGAWVGAGIGFLAGTVIGESRRQQERNASYSYSTYDVPNYGYGYSASVPSPSKPIQSAHAIPPTPSVWSAQSSRPQIPDAPRVPDAPTF